MAKDRSKAFNNPGRTGSYTPLDSTPSMQTTPSFAPPLQEQEGQFQQAPISAYAAQPQQSYGTGNPQSAGSWYQQTKSNIPLDTTLLFPAENMDAFYRQRDVINQYLTTIDANVNQIKWLNVKIQQEVDQVQVEKFEAKLEQVTSETEGLVKQTKDGIKILAKSKRGPRDIRSQEYQTALKKLNKAAQEFQNVQNAVKAARRSQITRQYKIAKPNATDDEIREAVDSGRSDVFSKAMLSSSVADQQRVLGEVEKRNRDLQQLTQSITQLFELMQELNFMINTQQEFLDLAEERVDKAIFEVEAGNQQLTYANQSATSARKTQMIIFVV
ncbi:t-SNARE, partial [Chytriomyces sp. MP71]